MAASPDKAKNKVIIDLCFSTPPESDQEGTPLRPIFCLKNRESMKEMENREDCFILDFDPDDPLDQNLLGNLDDASPDISVVAERGQVQTKFNLFRSIAGIFLIGISNIIIAPVFFGLIFEY